MAKQVVKTLATNMVLDTTQAKAGLKELNQAVKGSTNEAKILENQYKSSGDQVAASKAKYEGLQHALEAQKTKIDTLKQALENNNTETKKGQEVQTLLQTQLANSERAYAGYQGQLEKATQSYKYQESGLASLNDELKHSNSLTDARVQKLEAEGRTEEAQKVKLEGLKNTQENYTKQLEIQKKELQELASQGDKSSDSYKRQELRVEQMGAKLANTTGDIKHFNDVKIKPEVVGEATVKGKLESIDDKLDKTRGNFGKFLGANLIASGITNALQSVQSHISGIFQAGVDYNKQLQNINVGLDNFTNGNSKLSGQLKDIIQQTHEASGYALDTTTLLTKKSFGFMGKNVDKAKELSDAWINVGRSTGMSDEKLQASIGTFGKIAASGDITSSSLTKVNKSLPGFSSAMAQHMGITEDKLKELAKNGKLSMEDLGNGIEEMSKMKGGTKGLENYQKTFDGFTQHFDERYKSLSGKITESFFSQSNNMLSGLSKSLDGKEVDKSFNRIGDSANKAVNTVVKAFSSSFSGSKTNPVADMANFTADSIEKLGNWVAKHADDIKDFFTMVKELGATGFSAMGTTLKIALPLLEDLGKFASKHPTTFKVLAGSILGLNLALKATLSTMAVFGKTKAVFGSLSGLIIKPKVDGSSAKRELGIIGKLGKGIGKSFMWTAKLLTKALLDSLAFIGRTVTSATVGIAKGLKWTASIITKGATKALDLFKRGAVASGKGIGKALKFTASVATKGASLAMAGLVKTAKVTGTGIKLAFNFLKANPLILLITGIVAAVAALTALYKHNKKFRDFVNGLVKAAADFFKGIAKWFGQVVKTITETFNKVLKFMKKDWKEILLLIVNPFAGAFALLYKHNKKFRDNVNQLVKDVIKFFTNMGNAISDIFNNIKKTITNIFNSVKDFLFNTVKTMYNNWVASFNQMFNFFKGIWNGIKKFGSDSINSLKGTFDNVLGSIGKAFGNTWNGIKNGFSDMWNGMKDLAGKGINAVIKIPNAGISGINGLIHDFGGPKSALGQIPKVAFASGTGAFNNARRPINKPTLAVLNDGNDSPETGNKEALLHPNGQLEVVQGRNTERLLMPGTEVFNASELALLMGKQQFASGTGFLGSIWDGVKGAGSWVGKTAGNAWDGIKDATDKFTKMFGFITNAVAHPVKTLEGVFDPKSNSSLGNMMGGLATGTFKHVKTQATDWWKSLWSMASDEASGGGTSELLNKMVKAGTGKPYVWGATGPDSFDCSGLVQYALREMNKSFPHYSGDQWNASTPVSDPKAGDLAFFGPGGSDHVGVYSGNGKMFSAQSPQSSPNIGFANISDWSEPLAGYRRVPGLKSDDEKSSNSNPMASLIKGQVGGMFEWIKKFIAPTQDSPAEPAGDGVGRWRSDVTKALGKLGLSTSGSMISKVLKQIQTESGGNASAMGGNDGLADGNATGLMQVKPGTFRAYASAGHDNIMNGYDNILAGLAYAKNRYGSNLSFLGQGHGYANGGLITKHQIAEIGEGNKPEMIIPLDGMKSSRGFELLGKTAVAMAQRDGSTAPTLGNDGSKLESKLDAMIGLLSQLVNNSETPTPAYVIASQAENELNKLKQKRTSNTRLAMG